MEVQELKAIILRHTGRGNPVKAEDLAARFGYDDDRVIRKAIEDLITADFPSAA